MSCLTDCMTRRSRGIGILQLEICKAEMIVRLSTEYILLLN